MKFALLFIFIQFGLSASDIVFLRQNSAPKYAQGPKENGLCDLIYKELTEHLKKNSIETKILSTNFPIKRIIKMLEADEGNIFCGASKTEERKGKLIFSDLPVYSVSNVLITHKDNNYYPASLDEFKKSRLKLGSFYGTASSQYIVSIAGKFVSDQVTTLDEAAKLIGEKRIDYFFYHDLGLVELVNTSKYPIKLVPIKYRAIEQYLLYNKNIPQNVVEAINTKMKDLYDSKKINEIWSKFLYMQN